MTQPQIPLTTQSEAVADPRFAAPDTLTLIADSLDRAGASLLSPSLAQLAICRAELDSVVTHLGELQALAAQSRPSECAHLRARLAPLQKRSRLVQAMLRQGAAFYRAAEQHQTGSVLGYTPTGLEHAL